MLLFGVRWKRSASHCCGCQFSNFSATRVEEIKNRIRAEEQEQTKQENPKKNNDKHRENLNQKKGNREDM